MESKPQVTDFAEKLKEDVKVRQKLLDANNPIWVQLHQTAKHLLEMASKEIVFSPPAISREGIGIFRKGTINVIQGKFGSHKSRIAELFISLFLQRVGCQTNFVGFNKDQDTIYAGGYMDTERNIDEELPAMIQSIREKSGYSKTEEIPNFYVNSIKIIDRKDRLEALEIWIADIRKNDKNPLFVVLDVVTDCVGSFNGDGENMLLFDFLGNLCDKHKVIFLILIHENPGTEKARGHTGTEAANKASCVFQIGFERNAKGEDTELIKLKCLKLRGAKKPEPIYLEYCDTAKGLIEAQSQFIQETLSERKTKADVDLLKDKLEMILIEPMFQKDLLRILAETFDCSENTIKDRLRQMVDKQLHIYNPDGMLCCLKVEGERGKANRYFLEQISLPSHKSNPVE